ncbi:AcrR family transcriptional regulator [Peptoniphilus olsenii]|uniref:AcrR family transcriptional regulator n=1 Tax=Peptoniphilus olsenii TaxID=411570 RepID=A0ABV2JBW4_9FIRM
MKLKEKRMMSYFIEATREIIDEEGINKVTIRRIADKSGYNSATLYNYFKNLDVLLIYASISYFKDYIEDLRRRVNKVKDPIERYVAIYEVFNDFSFKYPDIYFNMFYGIYNDMLSDIIKEYYLIFPEELEEVDEDLSTMLTSGDMYKRDQAITKEFKCLGFSQEDVDFIIETTIRVHTSYLHQVVINKNIDKKAHSESFIVYLKELIKRVGDNNE